MAATYSARPWIDGILLENVSITVGSNDITHTLGRTPLGATIVLDDALPATFEAQLSENKAGVDGAVNNTWSKVQFDSEVYDYGSKFDHATNYNFTVPQDGLYEFSARVAVDVVPDQTKTEIRLGGTTDIYSVNYTIGGGDGYTIAAHWGPVLLTENDTVDVEIRQNGGSNETISQHTGTRFNGRSLIGYSAESSASTSTILRLYSDCDRTANLIVF